MSNSSEITPNETPQFNTMPAADRQREYSPSSAIGGDFMPYIEQYVAKSRQAYAACKNVQTIAYGKQVSQTLDIALPDNTDNSPVLFYIHGGYWQALSKRESFFAAADFVERGVAYAALDYTLAPHATLGEIVQECRAALKVLVGHASDLTVDAKRIVLAGSSAGAHLCAMCCADPDLHFQPAGTVLLSGIYELEPFVGISDNEAVGLDLEQAKLNSPMLLSTERYPDTIVSWGEHETLEFKRQSMAMANTLKSPTRDVQIFECAGRNHFDVVHDLSNLNTTLGKSVQNLLKQ